MSQITTVTTSNTFAEWLQTTSNLVALINILSDGGTTMNANVVVSRSNSSLILRANNGVTTNQLVIPLAGANAYFGTDSNNIIWTKNNDGAGSTMDADLLDGLDSLYFTGISNAAFDKANSANVHANSSYNFANTINVYSYSAYAQANAANTLAAAANVSAQVAFTLANTGNNNFVALNAYAISAYSKANLASGNAQVAFTLANTANITGQAAFDKANLAYDTAITISGGANSSVAMAQNAWNTANAAYAQANSAYANGNTTLSFAQGVSANLVALSTFSNASFAVIGTNPSLGGNNFHHIPGANVTGYVPLATAANTATSATSATTATTATGVTITNDAATNATMYPLWATANSGTQSAKVSSSKFSFNPSTGALSATSFSGSGSGLSGLSVPLAALAANTVTLGSTVITLGGTTTVLGGFTSITSTSFIGTATNAANTTNVSGGVAGNLIYQSAPGVTTFLANGTSSQVLVGGTTPSWSSTPALTGTNFTGIPGGAINSIVSSASAVTTTDDNSTNATMYPVFKTSNTGALADKVSSTKLNWNPSTGVFGAPTFSGSGASLTNLSSAALSANSITIGSTVVALGGSITSLVGFTSITSGSFSGGLNGTIGSVTPNTGAFSSITTASNVQVANLNSSLLQGNTWGSPQAIGNTAPNTVDALRIREKFNDYGLIANNATVTLDLAAYNHFLFQPNTVTTALVTVAVTNPPAAGLSQSFYIEIKGGQRSVDGKITWPAAFKWIGGAGNRPSDTSLATVASGNNNIFVAVTRDGGTRYEVQHLGVSG